jgi:hypothetical protein
MGQDGSMVVHRADRATIRKTLGSVYVAENVHRADAVTVHAAQGATAGQGHALLDESWTREQAYVALTRGKAENVLHVVAEDADEARAVVLRVLRSSEADRSAVLVALAKERHQQARVELTPGIAGRIRQATRSAIDLVGRWGSTSTLTATRPAAPAVAPEIPTRPPAAEL